MHLNGKYFPLNFREPCNLTYSEVTNREEGAEKTFFCYLVLTSRENIADKEKGIRYRHTSSGKASLITVWVIYLDAFGQNVNFDLMPKDYTAFNQDRIDRRPACRLKDQSVFREDT